MKVNGSSSTTEEPVEAADPRFRETAGDRPLRRDGDLIVSGRAEYLDDIAPPGLLHAALLRSPHPHARIVAIDISRLEGMRGVRAVLTGRDPQAGTALEHFFDPGKFGLNTATFTVLAGDVVRWVGEPIAAVAATTLAEAEEAVAAIAVEYEILPAVLEAEEALAEDAPLVFPHWSENAIGHFPFAIGEPRARIAGAPHRLRHEVRVGRHQSAPMEGRGYVADWRPGDRISFWGATQSPHMVRSNLALVLGVAEERIKVVAPRMGGGFGHKFAGYAEEVLVCLLSRAASAPVKWLESRADSLFVGAREFSHEVEFGFDDDGLLLGFTNRMLGNVGCLSTWGGWPMVWVAGMTFPGPYRCLDYAVEAVPVVTNKAPWSGYRAYGKEQVAVVMERMMDLIARHLDMDPAEVRRRNFVQPDEFPHWTASAHVDSGNYPGALESLLDLADYRSLLARRASARAEGRMVGVGIGFELTPENGDLLNGWSRVYDTSTVRINPSGGVTVLTGATSPGTGNETSIAFLVAREFGIDIERVEVLQGDTEVCPFGFGSFTSRALTTGGSAAVLAARDVRSRMARAARTLLELPEEREIVFEDGEVRAAGEPLARLGFGELAEKIYKLALGTPGLDDPLLEATKVDQPHNFVHLPDEQGRTSTYATFAFSAHLAVVEVDAETGVIALPEYCVVDDCGVVINPHFVEGQVYGAVAQGIGGAAWEEGVYDDAGHLAADTFKSYLVPRAPDLPPFRTRNQETPSPFTLLGNKGAGDGCVGGAMAALANAVNDAIEPLGASVDRLPLTPPRVLAAIEDAARREDFR